MPTSQFTTKEKYRYLTGFDSHLESEAVGGALPIAQNSPQKASYGLYNEKLSGTSFMAPRHQNKQTWVYRILPSCTHKPYHPHVRSNSTNAANEASGDVAEDLEKLHIIPNQLQWDPFDHDQAGTLDFPSGLKRLAGAGDPAMKEGCGIFIYAAGRNMDEKTVYCSADGDLLIVPQEGDLDIRTELGWILVRPMEICVIPRAIKYQVFLPSGPARGYALELYQNHFELPPLGVIGSHALANARDFQVPVACFSEDFGPTADQGTSVYTVISKLNHTLFAAEQAHTPFDIVAWQGTYYPYKYDLGRFNTIGTISYDHPDPSIFTCLSAPSHQPGTAVVDFILFPPRWLVGEDTFRPAFFHRNTMSEFMGIIVGDFDARGGGHSGFVPGGGNLHNVMSAHGADAESSEQGREGKLEPKWTGAGNYAFMFESSLMMAVTDWGLRTCKKVQQRYSEESWGGIRSHWSMPNDRAVNSHLLNEE
ncbi:Homogentisate 1,2-dioxygenase [Rhexocercosporidium sp. MPI-PUGE-AT-0058]|nr:Homogentisate 1,2-dioxygenase [Rhexocercosporidium sp. MPI-PUGE-AT-0058]